jgi:hypothetical protein
MRLRLLVLHSPRCLPAAFALFASCPSCFSSSRACPPPPPLQHRLAASPLPLLRLSALLPLLLLQSLLLRQLLRILLLLITVCRFLNRILRHQLWLPLPLSFDHDVVLRCSDVMPAAEGLIVSSDCLSAALQRVQHASVEVSESL